MNSFSLLLAVFIFYFALILGKEPTGLLLDLSKEIIAFGAFKSAKLLLTEFAGRPESDLLMFDRAYLSLS